MNQRFLLFALPSLSLLWLTMTVLIAGYLYPQYSHVSQFMSELGATGSPHGAFVNYLGFVPAELLILGFVAVLFATLPRSKVNVTGVVLIAIYAVSLGVAALFPCDFQCKPEQPSLSHLIHMASAFPAYFCGILAIFMLSSGSSLGTSLKGLKWMGYGLGGVALCALFNMDPASGVGGLYQRILELSIYTWLILLGRGLSQSSIKVKESAS